MNNNKQEVVKQPYLTSLSLNSPNFKYVVDLQQLEEKSEIGNICSICKFDYPTIKHLYICCHCNLILKGAELQKTCKECLKSFQGLQQRLQDKVAIINMAKSCGKPQVDDTQKVPLCCPCCNQEVQEQSSYQQFQSLYSQITLDDKTKLLKLQQFRMVIPNLLYVIGLPKKYGQENILRLPRFFGQYGRIKRVLINNFTKDYYDQQGQCAVYIWYEASVNVAIALKCLNGLRMGNSSQQSHLYSPSTLKCSFGTSKYCVNFLKESKCESQDKCPFLHYFERRRSKVIQDDIEFKEFIGQQDKIVEQFVCKMGLKTVGSKCGFYNFQEYEKDQVFVQGLPSPTQILGVSMHGIEQLVQNESTQREISKIEFLQINPSGSNDQNLAKETLTCAAVSVPSFRAVSVKLTYYKKGSKYFNEPIPLDDQSISHLQTKGAMKAYLNENLQVILKQNPSLSEQLQHMFPNIDLSNMSNFQQYHPGSIEYQLFMDKQKIMQKLQKKAEMKQKSKEIDMILKEKLDAQPWNPKPKENLNNTLSFCEPLEKKYDFDQKIDKHQQHVVTDCITHLGLFGNPESKIEPSSENINEILKLILAQNQTPVNKDKKDSKISNSSKANVRGLRA